MSDPTRALNYEQPRTREEEPTQTLSTMMTRQLQLAGTLQRVLSDHLEDADNSNLNVKETKEIVSAISNIMAMAHRTDEIISEVETYKAFVNIIIGFLQSRSDELSEDLIALLRDYATKAGAKKAQNVDTVLQHTVREPRSGP